MSAAQHARSLDLIGMPARQFATAGTGFAKQRDLLPTICVAGLVASWVICMICLLLLSEAAGSISAALQSLPNVMPFGVVVHPLAAADLTVKISHKLLSIATGAVPVMLLEVYVVGFARSSLGHLTVNRSASGTTDIGIFLVSAIGLLRVWKAVGTLGVAYVLGVASNEIISTITGHRLQVDTGFAALNFLIYLMAFTFFDYWCHRIFHTNPFWCLHRLHHAGTEMTTVSAVRDHPGVSLFEPMFKLWPVAFFAAPPAYMLAFAYALMFYEFLIHSNVPWTWGWFGRWILVPPAGHRLHHSIDTKNSGKLLAILPIWDRLFGTWCPITAADLNAQVGVVENHYNRGNLLHEILHDFAEFGRQTATALRIKPFLPPDEIAHCQD